MAMIYFNTCWLFPMLDISVCKKRKYNFV